MGFRGILLYTLVLGGCSYELQHTAPRFVNISWKIAKSKGVTRLLKILTPVSISNVAQLKPEISSLKHLVEDFARHPTFNSAVELQQHIEEYLMYSDEIQRLEWAAKELRMGAEEETLTLKAIRNRLHENMEGSVFGDLSINFDKPMNTDTFSQYVGRHQAYIDQIRKQRKKTPSDETKMWSDTAYEELAGGDDDLAQEMDVFADWLQESDEMVFTGLDLLENNLTMSMAKIIVEIRSKADGLADSVKQIREVLTDDIVSNGSSVETRGIDDLAEQLAEIEKTSDHPAVKEVFAQLAELAAGVTTTAEDLKLQVDTLAGRVTEIGRLPDMEKVEIATEILEDVEKLTAAAEQLQKIEETLGLDSELNNTITNRISKFITLEKNGANAFKRLAKKGTLRIEETKELYNLGERLNKHLSSSDRIDTALNEISDNLRKVENALPTLPPPVNLEELSSRYSFVDYTKEFTGKWQNIEVNNNREEILQAMFQVVEQYDMLMRGKINKLNLPLGLSYTKMNNTGKYTIFKFRVDDYRIYHVHEDGKVVFLGAYYKTDSGGKEQSIFIEKILGSRFETYINNR